MRYGLMALGLVVVALVAVPLLVVDKAAIKREIEAAVAERTGRQLEIVGDIQVSLLPTPRLAASGVRLANWGESAEPWMLDIAKVTATVSPFDLLRGDYVARTVELQSPRLLLERRAGRANWRFVPSGEIPPLPVSSLGLVAVAHAANGEPGAREPALFRTLVVHNGRIAYRDANGDRSVEISSIEADVAADAARGPFQGSGTAAIDGRAISFDGNAGRFQGDHAVPVRGNLRLDTVALKFDGLLLRNTDAGSVLKASVDAAIPDLGVLARYFGAAAPKTLEGRGLAYSGQLRLAASAGEIADGQLRLGPVTAKAGISWNLDAPRPRVAASIHAQHVDLDTWIEEPPGRSADAAPLVPRLVASAIAAEPAPDLGLPGGLDVAFDLAADTVVWRGQAAQSFVAEGELSRGDLVLNQVAVQLPGAAQARAFGFVGGGAAMRNLDVTVQASAANLRGLLDWVGFDVAGVPSDRLRRAGLSAQITGSRDALIKVRDIDLTLDATRAKGAVDLRWAQRPAFGLSLAVDNFNLDAYRPIPVPGAAKPAAAMQTLRAIPAVAAEPAAPIWSGFDANLDLRVGRLTAGGQPLDKVTAKGQWQAGVLDVATLSADLGGAGRLNATGKIRTLGEGAPIFEAVKADVTTPRADRLLALLPGGSPGFARDWRALSATLAADGPLADLKLDAAATVGEVKASLAGRFDGVKGIPADNGDARVSAPTLGALASILGAEVAPDLARKGKVEIHLPMRVSPNGFAIPAFTAKAGDIALDGNADVRTDGPRPFAKVQLSGDTLPWMTFASAASAPRPVGAIPTGFLPAALTPAAEAKPAWAALRDFDGELAARFEAVATPKLRATNVDAAMHLNQGILTLDRATAQLLGGSVKATGRADLTGKPRISANLDARDVVVAATSPVFDGNAPLAGKFTLTAEGESFGNDGDQLLRALDGKGEIKIVEGSFAGANLGAVNDRLNRVRNIQDIFGAIEAGSKGRTAFDSLTGHFVIVKGVLKSDDLAMDAPAGKATATGSADLAAQTLATDLRFTLDNLKDAPPLGIKLSGAWAQPRVVFDTGAFQAHVLQKGLGQFLKSLSKPQGDEPPPPAAVKPKDVLRELLAPIPQQPQG